ADLYNKGGHGIVLAYRMGHSGATYGIEVYHAQNIELPPSPPVIFRRVYVDQSNGNVGRPQILIYNKGDRDLSSYKIEKKNLNTNNGLWTEIVPSLQADGPGLGQVYIDFS